LLVPELTSITCSDTPKTYWIHGQHLDKIDAIADQTTSTEPLNPAQLDACDNGGLCLRVASAEAQPIWRIALRWVDQRVFQVKLGDVPACAP
jgi:hypothetical protein